VIALAAAAVVEDRLAPYVSRICPKRSATSAMAVSQSIGSKVPSGRRRSGLVNRCGPFW
jgi:hypothetical protein